MHQSRGDLCDLDVQHLKMVLLPNIRPPLPECRVEPGHVVLLGSFTGNVFGVLLVQALHQHLPEGPLAGLQQAHPTVDANLLMNAVVTPEIKAAEGHSVIVVVVPNLGCGGLQVKKARDVVSTEHINVQQRHLGILSLTQHQQLGVDVQKPGLFGVLEHAQGHPSPVANLLKGPKFAQHFQEVLGHIWCVQQDPVVVPAKTP
mmetsp:Transcript_40995/g.89328  ORF Transcript_40995/g.89328 Transcript_40995/m.89328 type:complete len:202 (-) Transcript_40995:884-1489(-)